jgi:hypothetical protein
MGSQRWNYRIDTSWSFHYEEFIELQNLRADSFFELLNLDLLRALILGIHYYEYD